MNTIFKHIGVFVVYLALQVLLFNSFTLVDMFTPFVFLLFLLMIPVTLDFSLTLILAFAAGILVDVFSVNQLTGLHAFSCVLMMSVRNLWIGVITNRVAFRGSEDVLLQIQPTPWYINYLLPLIFIHHVAYFFLEAFSFQNFGQTLLKFSVSTLYTFAICMIFILLFYRSNKR